jgi:hypothetical protein
VTAMLVKVAPGLLVLPDPLVDGLVGDPDILLLSQVSADLPGRPVLAHEPDHLLFDPFRGGPVAGQAFPSLHRHLVGQSPRVAPRLSLLRCNSLDTAEGLTPIKLAIVRWVSPFSKPK